MTTPELKDEANHLFKCLEQFRRQDDVKSVLDALELLTHNHRLQLLNIEQARQEGQKPVDPFSFEGVKQMLGYPA